MKYVHWLTFQTTSETLVYTVKSENRIMSVSIVDNLIKQYNLDIHETALINHAVFLNEEE